MAALCHSINTFLALQEWNAGSYYEASIAVQEREEKLAAAYEMVEKVGAL